MEAWHPGTPGSPAGKQTGEKKKMEITPDSTYRDGKKGDQIK